MIKVLLKRQIEDGEQGGAVTPCKAKKSLRLPLHLRDGEQQWFKKKKEKKRRKKKKQQIKKE